MMDQAKQRADLGFAQPDATDDVMDITGFNPADWDVGTPAPARPAQGVSAAAAKATGFHSREIPPAPNAEAGAGPAVSAPATQPGAGQGASPQPVRRRRTGRNAQFNLKARPETIQSFCAVADAQGWGLGETLEHAVTLLQREHGPK